MGKRGRGRKRERAEIEGGEREIEERERHGIRAEAATQADANVKEVGGRKWERTETERVGREGEGKGHGVRAAKRLLRWDANLKEQGGREGGGATGAGRDARDAREEQGVAPRDPVSVTLSFASPDKAGSPTSDSLPEDAGPAPGSAPSSSPRTCPPAGEETSAQPSCNLESSAGALLQPLDDRPARVGPSPLEFPHHL